MRTLPSPILPLDRTMPLHSECRHTHAHTPFLSQTCLSQQRFWHIASSSFFITYWKHRQVMNKRGIPFGWVSSPPGKFLWTFKQPENWIREQNSHTVSTQEQTSVSTGARGNPSNDSFSSPGKRQAQSCVRPAASLLLTSGNDMALQHPWTTGQEHTVCFLWRQDLTEAQVEGWHVSRESLGDQLGSLGSLLMDITHDR